MPVVLEAGVDRVVHRANLVDLALCGARLALADPISPGTQVSLELRSALLWDPLCLRGHVMWAKQDASSRLHLVGLRFDHDSPAALFCLFELLGSHAFGSG